MELINYCEFDKYASRSYAAIHNISESLNLGDITKIDLDKLPQVDFITHGSPCQDFSICGKGLGTEGQRSILMFNSVEIIRRIMPKFVLWENVKNVLSQKHRHNFDAYLSSMTMLGYTNYYQVLNAKNYGIPQNRERIFCLSIRNDINKGFDFPIGFDNGLRIKHFLEDNVSQQFTVKKILNFNLTNKYIQFSNSGKMNDSQAERLYYQDGCIGSIPAKNGGDKTQVILGDRTEFFGFLEKHDYRNSINDYVSRKLTPKECFRLMGFTDEDYNAAQSVGTSNAQLYKQAGNSIVVNVLEEIYKQIQLVYPDFKDVTMLSLFSGIGAFESAFRVFNEVE